MPNGWNSWTGGSGTGGYGQDITEMLFLQSMEAFRTELLPFGDTYFQLDDGYQEATGDWAFKQVEGQDVSFFSCTIDVEGVGAAAACVGTTNFVPKIGNRSPQSGPSQWNFKLSRRSAGVWLIDDVQAR